MCVVSDLRRECKPAKIPDRTRHDNARAAAKPKLLVSRLSVKHGILSRYLVSLLLCERVPSGETHKQGDMVVMQQLVENAAGLVLFDAKPIGCFHMSCRSTCRNSMQMKHLCMCWELARYLTPDMSEGPTLFTSACFQTGCRAEPSL